MTVFNRIGVLLLATIVCAFCLELGERFEIPGVHGFVSTVQAIVGRPMTPMSVARFARRDCAPLCSGRLQLLRRAQLRRAERILSLHRRGLTMGPTKKRGDAS
jgi:hypothetical protein